MIWYIAIGSDGRAIITRNGFLGLTSVYGPHYDLAEAIEQAQAHNRHWVETIVSDTNREEEIVVH